MSKVKSTFSRELDPFHTADWRWQRAFELLACKRRPGRYDDPQTRIVLKYLKCMMHKQGAAISRAALRRWQDLIEAHRLHDRGGLIVDEVQARLLAGESFDHISAKTGVPSSVLHVFESTFFAVKDHLRTTGWLIDNVLQTHKWIPTCLTAAQVWQWTAISAGSIPLDLLIAEDVGRDLPNITDRTGFAEKARYDARAAVTPFTPGDSLKLMEDGALLFGYIGKNGKPNFSSDPPLQSAYTILRFTSGKVPARKLKKVREMPGSSVAASKRVPQPEPVKNVHLQVEPIEQKIDFSLGVEITQNEAGFANIMLAAMPIA